MFQFHLNVKAKCRDPGSNRGPLDLQSNALPTELSRQTVGKHLPMRQEREGFETKYISFMIDIRFILFICIPSKGENMSKEGAPPGGLEPPTFRLTAERASQLRHGGFYK